MEINSDLVEKLKKLTREETIGDLIEAGEDVCIDDFAGGNVDDAYWSGFNDGRVVLAREILNFLFK
jgi:hypothetical protein